MVDNLISKSLAWENEKQKLFLYDGVSDFKIFQDVSSFWNCLANWLLLQCAGAFGVDSGGLQASQAE